MGKKRQSQASKREHKPSGPVNADRETEDPSGNDDTNSFTYLADVDFLSELSRRRLTLNGSHGTTSFDIQVVEGDGNCLFRALSYAINGHSNGHADIRAGIVQYILSDESWNNFRDDIRSQMEDYNIPQDQRSTLNDRLLKKAYGDAMSKTGTYGRAVEVQAAAQLYRRTIGIIELLSTSHLRVHHSAANGDERHMLIFSGNRNHGHFNYLREVHVPSSQALQAGVYGVSAADTNHVQYCYNDQQFYIHGSNVEEDEPNEEDEKLALAEFKVHTKTCKKGIKLTSAVYKGILKKGRKTIFLVHGYKGGEGSAVIQETVDILLNSQETDRKIRTKRMRYRKARPYNIISVVWSKAAASLTYLPSKYSVGKVADEILGVVKTLVRKKLCSIRELIFIGHSLGAHICGIACKYIAIAFDTKPDYIYAIEAAGVGFDQLSDKDRLCRDDANHVVGLNTTRTLGTTYFYGHVNTVINWRSPEIPMRAHVTVVKYFNRTIRNPDCYAAVRRDRAGGSRVGTETARIGWQQSKESRGLFYIEINSKRPYKQKPSSRN